MSRRVLTSGLFFLCVLNKETLISESKLLLTEVIRVVHVKLKSCVITVHTGMSLTYQTPRSRTDGCTLHGSKVGHREPRMVSDHVMMNNSYTESGAPLIISTFY